MKVKELIEKLKELDDGLEVFIHSDDGENGGPCRSAELHDKDDGYPYMQANNYPETAQKFFLLRG